MVCSPGRWLHVCQTWVEGSHSCISTLHAAALKLLTLPTLRSTWSRSLKILRFLYTGSVSVHIVRRHVSSSLRDRWAALSGTYSP